MSRLHVALLRDPQWRTFEERTSDAATAAPDPVPFTRGAQAGDRDLGELATTAVSTVISRLLGRERAEWRGAVQGMRSALEAMERASDLAGPLHPTELAAEISEMVREVMAAAARKSTAALDEARAEARATIDEVESRLAQVEAESQQKLTAAVARQQEEQALRVRAEEARAEAERIHREVVAGYESRLETVRLRAEDERLHFLAVREQLVTCLEQAIQMVHGHETGFTASATLPPASVTDTFEPEARSESDDHSDAPDLRAGEPVAIREAAVRAGQGQPLGASTPAHEAAPEVIESIQQSLTETEAAYWVDIAAKTPLEAVALLTANLRVARAQLAARFAQRGEVVGPLFEDQLLAVLNARGDTSYGRHLSISVRELYPAQGSTAAAPRGV